MNDIEANQAYGALTTEFYIAGFTFERAMARVLRLLKSGDWRQVGSGFDDVNAFMRSLPLDQFKIIAEQRREFVERVKELQPEVSNRAIAGALGVHHDTIDRVAHGGNPPGADREAKGNGGRMAEIRHAAPPMAAATPPASISGTAGRSVARKSF
jgi:hypothetical protein